jgi:hypothetical protein
MARPICNPHLGKAAYTTASAPCVKVVKPCGLQPAPPYVPPQPVNKSPITPACVTIIFASDPAEITPEKFTYNTVTERYESADGGKIIYDMALGWIVQTGISNYTGQVKSRDPINTYKTSGGNVLSIVPCASVPVAPKPTCIKSVYADDANVVLGEFLVNGDGNYTPNNPSQGAISYVLNWTLNVNNVIYQGGSDVSDPTGLYTNGNNTILVKRCNA